MFNPLYIKELLSGNLSKEGYNHFLNVFNFFVNQYKWPNSIINSNEGQNSRKWTPEDIKILAHRFFEWSIKKGKLDYLHKIPYTYLSYYLCQIFISFIAYRIKDEQQKIGLSFEKCKELVQAICKDEYYTFTHNKIYFVYKEPIDESKLKSLEDLSDINSYLQKISINDKIKHFRPLIKSALIDFFNILNDPIPINKLIELIYSRFDQKHFYSLPINEQSIDIDSFINDKLFIDNHINDITSTINKEDARIIYAYLFQNDKNLSFNDMALQLKIPKSTLHYKVDAFKKKVSEHYIPENEEDGIYFIEKLADKLDKLAN